MKSYVDLSTGGKLRRLRSLAISALSQYQLKDLQIAFQAFETNLLYRVTTTSRERFMLRLTAPGWRTLVDLQSEAAWVNSLYDWSSLRSDGEFAFQALQEAGPSTCTFSNTWIWMLK